MPQPLCVRVVNIMHIANSNMKYWQPTVEQVYNCTSHLIGSTRTEGLDAREGAVSCAKLLSAVTPVSEASPPGRRPSRCARPPTCAPDEIFVSHVARHMSGLSRTCATACLHLAVYDDAIMCKPIFLLFHKLPGHNTWSWPSLAQF